MRSGGGAGRPARGDAPGAVLIAALVVAACANPPVDATAPKAVRDHVLTPYAMHGECLRVAAGERIEYYFTSTEPVDFNIRYHDAGAVLMPVVRDATREDSGVFAPRFAQDYCLTWEAGPAGASLDYRFRLRPPAPPR